MENIRDNIAVVISNANENITPYETIDTIANAGFKNVFIQLYNRNWSITQEEQLKYVKEKGLNIIFAHLGYDILNAAWLGNDYYRDILLETYKHDLDYCAKYGIDLVIMHAHGKMPEANFNYKGIEFFQKVADYAEKLNIRIAFENTKLKGYSEFLLDNIKSKNVGICFDSGHYHVYFRDEFNFGKFKDRIFAIHLHDNDQSADQHLLPYDGTLDWNRVIENIKSCNYKGPITLEIIYRRQYLNISPLEFYKNGYEIGEKLYNMMYKK